MKDTFSVIVLAFRLLIVGCSIIYIYFLVGGKWIENEEGRLKPRKLRSIIGAGAFLTLFLTLFYGIGLTVPFIKKVSYYWWEGDIYIPIRCAVALIASIWLTSSLHKRYCEIPMMEESIAHLQKENRELQLHVRELEDIIADTEEEM